MAEKEYTTEDIHLPGPSLLPLTCAIGITLIVVGLTAGPFVYGPGAIITLWTIIKWVASTRSDIKELPPAH